MTILLPLSLSKYQLLDGAVFLLQLLMPRTYLLLLLLLYDFITPPCYVYAAKSIELKVQRNVTDVRSVPGYLQSE